MMQKRNKKLSHRYRKPSSAFPLSMHRLSSSRPMQVLQLQPSEHDAPSDMRVQKRPLASTCEERVTVAPSPK